VHVAPMVALGGDPNRRSSRGTSILTYPTQLLFVAPESTRAVARMSLSGQSNRCTNAESRAPGLAGSSDKPPPGFPLLSPALDL